MPISPRLRALVEPLLRQLSLNAPPPTRVLEIGCGNGATARLLVEKGYDVTAVDPSSSGIEIASSHKSEQLRVEQASTNELKKFGQFPVVISLEVIEHCPSARDFMSAFANALAPGGVGILSTPYHGYLKNLAVVASGRFDSHFDPLWEGGHLKFFSLAKLRTLVEEFGFRRYEFHRVGRIPIFAKSVIVVLHRDE